VAADLLFKGLAYVLLTPLISLLFRGFLRASGRVVLADVDIAQFFLHPLGWLTLVTVGGGLIGVWALEQGVLMTINHAAQHGQALPVDAALRFILGKAAGVFSLASRAVARLVPLTAPFLLMVGGLYWWLLTDHDINYYLSAKPPKFWVAVVLIASVLSVMAALLLRAAVNWSVALQLYLFENVPPRECLRMSRNRVFGSRKAIATWIVIWFGLNLLISSAISGTVLLIGRLVMPATTHSLPLFLVTLALLLCLWGAAHLAGTLLSILSLASLQSQFYLRFGRPQAFVPIRARGIAPTWFRWLTAWRVGAGIVIAVLLATLVGANAVRGLSGEDRVEITSHRGASAKAPENTLASVRQAIKDETDWVEIDVQESKDGVVIVAHDSDLKKVSGSDVRIWDATADELREIDVGSYFDPQFKLERVPTLAEVLATCRDRVRVNVELKYYGHDQDLERKVADLIEEHEMTDQVVIMSLDARGVKKMKALRPEWTVGLLAAVSVGDLTRAEADFLAVNAKLATPAFIAAAHRRGKQVHVWTVNDPLTMSLMVSRGVDNLITDRPDVARQVLRDRAAMSPLQRNLVELAFIFGIAPPTNDKQ
jgi:glycerophosphoryl diester phosphodiesterase